MKNIRFTFALTLIVMLLAYVSCTDTENNPIMDTVDLSTITDSTDIASPAGIEDDKTPVTGKFIYLTIDDAPLNGSEYIDSIISTRKVKTNLFIVGNPIDGSGRFRKYHNQFRKNSYIEMYNHSYSHANNKYSTFYKNPQKVLQDFEENQTKFNIQHKIARLPGRNLWQVGNKKKNYRQTGATSAALLSENGYNVFGWDVEWKYNPKDYSPQQTVDELIDEIRKLYDTPSMVFASGHVVLLMHIQMFGVKNDKNDLELLIEKLREMGCTFEHLSAYPVTSIIQ